VKAASRLIEGFKRDKATLGPLTQKMEKLWIALISLANVQDKKNTDGLKKYIAANSPLLNLPDMSSVAVPTTTVPVIQSGEYRDIIGKLAVY